VPFPGSAQLDCICDSLSEAVVAVDRELRVLSWNRAAERLSGVAREAAVGSPCEPLLGAEIRRALERTLATAEPTLDRPTKLSWPDRGPLPVRFSTSPLRDEDDVLVGAVVTVRDTSLVERLRRDLEGRAAVADFVTRSPRVRQLLEILPAVAESDSTVLVQGESGTGKELIARAVHDASRRREGPFVVLNCGALPGSLVESELFGHVRGAFTDARRDRPGQAALADGGTLFLDEIGELEPGLQVKLLRLLQERTFLPLGATETVTVDVRFVAATNRDLRALVDEGRFREDLYYRLNVVPLVLPPLRERPEDVPALVEHFVTRLNALRGRSVAGVSERALTALAAHPWPGNVRQLQNAVEHAFVLCGDGRIEPEHLPPEVHAEPYAPASPRLAALDEMEAQVLRAALERNGWSRKRTAAELGIHPSTLYRKMRARGIDARGRDGRGRRRW
jgi:PAS domain S-box-containing protein